MTVTDEQSMTSGNSGPHGWFETSPLLWHGLALCLLLLIGAVLVLPSEVWSSDEGAIRLQAEALESGNGWLLDRPFSEIDPERVTAPIQASTINDYSYAPFAKHPATAVIVSVMPGPAGSWTAILPSIAGSVVAAILVGMIAGMLSARARNYALWAAGLATPLFFYSYTVLQHTIGVAVAATAVLGAFLWIGNRSALGVGAMAAAVFILPFVRREGLLLVLAIALAMLFVPRGMTVLLRGSIAMALVIAGLLGFVANGQLAVAVAGNEAQVEGDRAFLSLERMLQGFSGGMVSFDGATTLNALWVLMFVVGTVLICRSIVLRPDNFRLHLIFGCLVLAGGAGIVLGGRPALSGALVAMPWVVGGLVVVDRRMLADERVQFSLAVGLMYIGAVLLTQERHAGGSQWGGRYLMLALPVLVPTAVVAISMGMHRLDRLNRRLIGSTFIWIIIVMVVTSISVLHAGRTKAVRAETQWATAAIAVGDDGSGGGPVMMSPDSQLGRFAWSHVESIQFFMIPTDLERYIERYTAQRPTAFIYMGTWTDEIEAMFLGGGYGVVGDVDESGSVTLRTMAPVVEGASG